DGTPESEVKIKELTKGGTARCIAEELPEDTDLLDSVTGKKARILAYFARAY
ncbi:MAG: proline--tRNA ligase, partial [Bacilli bacterium]|nr:proline--tRNA ligase [Bacilli bacterium]